MRTRLGKHPIPCTSAALLLLLLFLYAGCARKNFYPSTPLTDLSTYQVLKESPETVDSVTLTAGSHYARGPVYRLFWGNRHRNAWAATVVVPVLQVKTKNSGLQVERIGGGMQSVNATLVGGDGMTYALRSVDKRPEVNLPSPFQNLFLADLVKDQSSALHPYASLVVAPLAEAAGIPHATPELVYVRPNEQEFGEHRELLSDKLYMLEEKFNDKRALVGQLKDASDIVSTKKMIKKRDEQPYHTIDQVAFAKARLLDLLIGDRDRHEDQWEWAVYEQDQLYIYRPIPKDRDNAFFRFDDGLFSWLLSRKWAQRKFVTFHGNYRDVKALMIKSAYIDSQALPQVTRQQFDSLAHSMQLALTDDVIDKAVQKLPKSVYVLDSQTLAGQLKNRRNTLDKAAREFYKALAEKVQVGGTEQSDIFEVTFLNEKEVEVVVRAKDSGLITFRRRFHSSETEEIKLKALAGDDEIRLQGKAGKGIEITFDGGKGHDKLTTEIPARKRKKTLELENVEQVK